MVGKLAFLKSIIQHNNIDCMKKYIKEKIGKNIYAKGKTYKKISLSLILNDNTHSLTIYIPSQL